MSAAPLRLSFSRMIRCIPKPGRVYCETTRGPFLTCFQPYFCYKTSEIQASQSFVTSSAICRDRHTVCSRLARPRENLMLRTVKLMSLSFLVVMISALGFAQGGAATGDLYVSVKDPKG